VGKSSLIREFPKENPHYIEIQGLAPAKGINNEDQLQHFMQELAGQTNYPEVKLKDWRQAFQILSHTNFVGRSDQ